MLIAHGTTKTRKPNLTGGVALLIPYTLYSREPKK